MKLTTEQKQEIVARYHNGEKRIEKLEQKIEILQTVNCTVSSHLKRRLYELEALHGQHNVHTLCEALQVDRGTFYNHILRNYRFVFSHSDCLQNIKNHSAQLITGTFKLVYEARKSEMNLIFHSDRGTQYT